MAAALTAHVAVVYEAAAPDCPEADEFASRVNAVLGRRALEPAPPGRPAPEPERARVEVRLGAEGARRTARLVASGALWGSRELEDGGATCEALAEAVVTSLTLMVESASAGAPAPAPAPAPGEPRHLEASVGAFGALGLLKGPRPGAWLGAQMGLGRPIGLGLGFAYVPPGATDEGDVDVKLGLIFGQAEACALAWRRPWLALSACAGGALGGLSGRASGVAEPSSRLRPWVAVAAGVAASGPSRAGFGWWGRLGAWVPLGRQGFRVDGVGEVFEPSPVAAGLGGGVRWSNW